jgi:Bacterial regulatory proteins, gntR family
MTTLAWVAVAEKIRREIVNGKSGPNGELDTEAELCRRFATSRITVRRALAELRADGLITSRRGSGTRAVVPPTPPVSLVVTTGSISANPIAPIRTGVRWRTLRPTGELVAALRRAGRDEVSKGHWLRLTYGQRANEFCSTRQRSGSHRGPCRSFRDKTSRSAPPRSSSKTLALHLVGPSKRFRQIGTSVERNSVKHRKRAST